MRIQAKFKCDKVIKTQQNEQVNLSVVTADSVENKTFAKYTPAGELTMTITNPDAFGAFVPGKEYCLSFDQAE